MRLGVLDIGSNTIHSLVVDAHYGAAPVPAHSQKIELKLSQYAMANGEISQDAIHKLTEFIHLSQESAEALGVSKTIAFATSAIRDAPNGDELCEQVTRETGVRIDILSGLEEAELTYLAARRWVGWSAGRIMTIDIGGGSLELAVGDDEEPDHAVSLPLGAGLLTREFIREDPPSADSIKLLRKHIRAEIASNVSKLSKGDNPRLFVGTSKTLKQLARIAGAKDSSAGIYVQRHLSLDGVRGIIERLSELTDSQRRSISGVSAARSAQMMAGALVAEASLELFHADTMLICPWASREGVILRELDSLPSH